MLVAVPAEAVPGVLRECAETGAGAAVVHSGGWAEAGAGRRGAPGGARVDRRGDGAQDPRPEHLGFLRAAREALRELRPHGGGASGGRPRDRRPERGREPRARVPRGGRGSRDPARRRSRERGGRRLRRCARGARRRRLGRGRGARDRGRRRRAPARRGGRAGRGPRAGRRAQDGPHRRRCLLALAHGRPDRKLARDARGARTGGRGRRRRHDAAHRRGAGASPRPASGAAIRPGSASSPARRGRVCCSPTSSEASACACRSCRRLRSSGSASCCRRSPSSGTRSTRAGRARRSARCSTPSARAPGIDLLAVYLLDEPDAVDPVALLGDGRARPPCSRSPRLLPPSPRPATSSPARASRCCPPRSAARERSRRSCGTRLSERGVRRARARSRRPAFAPAGDWDEDLAKRLVAEAGLAVPARIVCATHDEAFAALAQLRPPLVVKILDPAIEHKSDVGGVRLGIRDESELEARARCDRCARARGTPVPDRGDRRRRAPS